MANERKWRLDKLDKVHTNLIQKSDEFESWVTVDGCEDVMDQIKSDLKYLAQEEKKKIEKASVGELAAQYIKFQLKTSMAEAEEVVQILLSDPQGKIDEKFKNIPWIAKMFT